MKKLFFAAAIAIVAVGGALSANAAIYYLPNSPYTEIDCTGDGLTCTEYINQEYPGTSTVKTESGGAGSTIQVDEISSAEQFND